MGLSMDFVLRLLYTKIIDFIFVLIDKFSKIKYLIFYNKINDAFIITKFFLRKLFVFMVSQTINYF
jgi:hypothetical protein